MRTALIASGLMAWACVSSSGDEAGTSASAGAGGSAGSHASSSSGKGSTEAGGRDATQPSAGATAGGSPSASNAGGAAQAGAVSEGGALSNGGSNWYPPAGGQGGEAVTGPECAFPTSNRVDTCGYACPDTEYSGRACECAMALDLGTETVLLSTKVKFADCQLGCGAHRMSWFVPAGMCSKFTSMPGSGLGFGLGCSDTAECFVVSGGDAGQGVTTTEPSGNAWVHTETVALDGDACPLECP
jgi:hypothetical protein